MSEIAKKPSEKIVSNRFDGREVTDQRGRKLKLRKPDILDTYDLMSAIGPEDSMNPRCLEQAVLSLHVATIDGLVLESPKSRADFRANLKRLDESGLDAVRDFFNAEKESSETESWDKIKK